MEECLPENLSPQFFGVKLISLFKATGYKKIGQGKCQKCYRL